MPETMWVDCKSKGSSGAIAHGVINGHGAHRPALVGCPWGGVSFGTTDAAAEPLEIQIDAGGQLSRDRIVERALAFRIRGGNIQSPKITCFHEVNADAHCDEGTTTHRNECQKSDDQPVPVLESMGFGHVLGGVRIDDSAIHELEP